MKEIDSKYIYAIIKEYHALSEESKAASKEGEYPSPHPDLHNLLGNFVRSGFIEMFDWQAWLETIGNEHLKSIEYLEKSDLETLRKLMTAHLRIERFAAGHLQGLFASGYMHAFILRLEALLSYK